MGKIISRMRERARPQKLEGAALHAYMLLMAAHTARCLTLHGDSYTPAFNWFQQEPAPGDLVFETGTAHRVYRGDPGRALLAVGTLIRTAWEPFPGDWSDEPKVPLERIYYIRGLDGREHRWTNAQFQRVPNSPEPWRA